MRGDAVRDGGPPAKERSNRAVGKTTAPNFLMVRLDETPQLLAIAL